MCKTGALISVSSTIARLLFCVRLRGICSWCRVLCRAGLAAGLLWVLGDSPSAEHIIGGTHRAQSSSSSKQSLLPTADIQVIISCGMHSSQHARHKQSYSNVVAQHSHPGMIELEPGV